MKEWLKKMNQKLTGYRGLITTIGTYATIYTGSFFDNLTGINVDHLRGAALAAIPISLKLIWTDVVPKVKDWLSK